MAESPQQPPGGGDGGTPDDVASTPARVNESDAGAGAGAAKQAGGSQAADRSSKAETADIAPNRAARPGFFRRVWRAFATLVVVALGLGALALLGYLLSELNHRKYRFSGTIGQLVVERGAYRPYGYEPFRPHEAPIALPAGVVIGESEVFLDRTDLDRALFAVLANLVRELLPPPGVGEDGSGGRGAGASEGVLEVDSSAAELYLRRCEMLPGLSPEQRRELQTLRADVVFWRATSAVRGVLERLNGALKQFEQARELGTTYLRAAERWIADLNDKIGTLGLPPASLVPQSSIDDGEKGDGSELQLDRQPESQPMPQEDDEVESGRKGDNGEREWDL